MADKKSLKEELSDLLEREPKVRGAAGVLAGSTAGSAAGALSTVPGMLAERKDLAAKRLVKTPEVRKLLRIARKELKTPVYYYPGQPYMYRFPAGGKEGFIQVPAGVKAHGLAHEMGHANPKGRFLRGKPLILSYQMGTIAPAVAGVAGAGAAMKLLADEDPKKAKQIAQVGALLSAIGAAPHLYEEARATTHGLKYLRQAGMSTKDIIRKGLPLALQQLSYPAYTLLPALGLYLGSKLIKDEEK